MTNEKVYVLTEDQMKSLVISIHERFSSQMKELVNDFDASEIEFSFTTDCYGSTMNIDCSVDEHELTASLDRHFDIDIDEDEILFHVDMFLENHLKSITTNS